MRSNFAAKVHNCNVVIFNMFLKKGIYEVNAYIFLNKKVFEYVYDLLA